MKLPEYRQRGVEKLTPEPSDAQRIANEAANKAKVGAKVSEMGMQLFDELQDRRDTIEIQNVNTHMAETDTRIADIEGRDYIPVSQLEELGIDVSQHTTQNFVWQGGKDEDVIQNFKVFPEIQRKLREDAAARAAEGISYGPLREKFEAEAKVTIEKETARSLVVARDQAEKMQQEVTLDNIDRLTEQGKYEEAKALAPDLTPDTQEPALFGIMKAEVIGSLDRVYEKNIDDVERKERFSSALETVKAYGKEVYGDQYEAVKAKLEQDLLDHDSWMTVQNMHQVKGVSIQDLKVRASQIKNDDKSISWAKAVRRLVENKGLGGGGKPTWNDVLHQFNPALTKLRNMAEMIGVPTPDGVITYEQVFQEGERLKHIMHRTASEEGGALGLFYDTDIINEINSVVERNLSTGELGKTDSIMMNSYRTVMANPELGGPKAWLEANPQGYGRLASRERTALLQRIGEDDTALESGVIPAHKVFKDQYSPIILDGLGFSRDVGDKPEREKAGLRYGELFSAFTSKDTGLGLDMEATTLRNREFMANVLNIKYTMPGWGGKASMTFKEMADRLKDEYKREIFFQSLEEELRSGKRWGEDTMIQDAFLRAHGAKPGEIYLGDAIQEAEADEFSPYTDAPVGLGL